ncbi:MAG: ATP-binding cassette domain-containing protein [Coriobacteriia bacterium]|nr:ATP-binding cassette domain-containing protein [Coriobacteriia bacterium]MBN2822335.1 ATP-binding cassette domain-containing protein [Coriobacteriia bacterium]
MSETALLSARDLRAERPGDDGPVAVLAGIDLTLNAGDVVELAGPSGAGKTTLLLALARLLPGVTGDLHLVGVAARDIPAARWRTRVALLPQRATLVPGTVATNLRLPWELQVRSQDEAPGDGALRDALTDVGLGGVSLDRDASRLSVGQASRIALLRVLLTQPSVLLLDEPDASLDDASAAQVARKTAAFAAAGGAVLRISHVRADAAACARYRLEHGLLTQVSA